MSLMVRLIVLATLLAGWLVPAQQAHAQGASELRMRRIVFFSRFEQGRNYFYAGQYLESAAYFRSLLQDSTDLPPFIALRVKYFYGASLDELKIAISGQGYLQEVLASNISVDLWADAAVRVVRALRADQRYAEIVPIWQQASARVPTPKLLDPIRWEVARAYDAQGKHDDAIFVLDPIDTRSEYYGPAQYLIGILQQKTKRTQGAMETFTNLSQRKSDLDFWGKSELADMAVLAIARIYFDQGDYSRALVTYRKVGDLFRDRAQVLFEMAWCYASLEQYDGAIAQLAELIALFPASQQAKDAMLLSGYFRMQDKQFELSYDTFATAEVAYNKVATTLRQFIGRVPTDLLLGQMVSKTALEAQGLPTQVTQWIESGPTIREARRVEESITNVERALSSIQNDLQEIRILTAAYGASFRNPLTLELRVRDDAARALADIQRQILELMAKPFRDTMRNNEYAMLNRSQQVLDELLNVIDVQAGRTRTVAITKQDSLQGVGDYMRLVEPQTFGGFADPATLPYQVDFRGTDVLRSYRETLTQRQGLSLILMGVSGEEDALWAMVIDLITQQREILESALRRMNVWGKYDFLVSLDRMYQKSMGLQSLVVELSQLLQQVREKTLVEVMESTEEQGRLLADLQAVAAEQAALVNRQRYLAIAAAVKGVQFEISEIGVNAAIGKLDLNWRINKNEELLRQSVQRAESERSQQMKASYKRIVDRLEKPMASAKEMVLPDAVRSQLGQDVDSDEIAEMLKAISEAEQQLATATFVKDELKRGTESMLHRKGTVGW